MGDFKVLFYIAFCSDSHDLNNMERSKIFKVPIGLQKTILYMLKTGEVDTTMLSAEDKAWVLRWGMRLGILTDNHNYTKTTKRLEMVDSTNPDYFLIKVFEPET